MGVSKDPPAPEAVMAFCCRAVCNRLDPPQKPDDVDTEKALLAVRDLLGVSKYSYADIMRHERNSCCQRDVLVHVAEVSGLPLRFTTPAVIYCSVQIPGSVTGVTAQVGYARRVLFDELYRSPAPDLDGAVEVSVWEAPDGPSPHSGTHAHAIPLDSKHQFLGRARIPYASLASRGPLTAYRLERGEREGVKVHVACCFMMHGPAKELHEEILGTYQAVVAASLAWREEHNMDSLPPDLSLLLQQCRAVGGLDPLMASALALDPLAELLGRIKGPGLAQAAAAAAECLATLAQDTQAGRADPTLQTRPSLKDKSQRLLQAVRVGLQTVEQLISSDLRGDVPVAFDRSRALEVVRGALPQFTVTVAGRIASYHGGGVEAKVLEGLLGLLESAVALDAALALYCKGLASLQAAEEGIRAGKARLVDSWIAQAKLRDSQAGSQAKNVASACEQLTAHIKDDMLLYAQVLQTHLGLDVLQLDTDTLCPALEANVVLSLEGADCRLADLANDVAGRGGVFDLYFAVRRLDDLLAEAKTKHPEMSDGLGEYTSWFAPYMLAWLAATGEKQRQWIDNACSHDSALLPLSDTTLVSSSVPDVFSCLAAPLEFMVRLDWPDSNGRAMFALRYAEDATAHMRGYAEWLLARGLRCGEKASTAAGGTLDIPRGLLVALNNTVEAFDHCTALQRQIKDELIGHGGPNSDALKQACQLVDETFRPVHVALQRATEGLDTCLEGLVRDALCQQLAAVAGLARSRLPGVGPTLRQALKAAMAPVDGVAAGNERLRKWVSKRRKKSQPAADAPAAEEQALADLLDFLDNSLLAPLSAALYKDVFAHVLDRLWALLLQAITGLANPSTVAPGWPLPKKGLAPAQAERLETALDQLTALVHADGEGLSDGRLYTAAHKQAATCLRLTTLALPLLECRYLLTQLGGMVGGEGMGMGIELALDTSTPRTLRVTLKRAYGLPAATNNLPVAVEAQLFTPSHGYYGAPALTCNPAVGPSPQWNEVLHMRLPEDAYTSMLHLAVHVQRSQTLPSALKPTRTQPALGQQRKGKFVAEAVVGLNGDHEPGDTLVQSLVRVVSPEATLVLDMLALRPDKEAAKFVERRGRQPVAADDSSPRARTKPPASSVAASQRRPSDALRRTGTSDRR